MSRVGTPTLSSFSWRTRDGIRFALRTTVQQLDERRKLMQTWSDYLEALKVGGEIVPIHRTGQAA